MNRFLILFLVMLFVAFSWGQNKSSVSGIVVDENGEAAFSVNVIVDVSKGLAAITDFNGKFKIELPPGEYSVMVRYIGYQEQVKSINLSLGEEKQLDFDLIKSEELIGEIEVYSPTKRGISSDKEVVTVETISSDIIENNVITIGSDAVDKVPGVTLLDGQISIRGGSGYAYGTGSRVILVIDEIPLLSPERNEVLWDFIPMENVRSIDVVKGASSVQYGAAALNGIVAVNTKWPSKKTETNVSLFAGFMPEPAIQGAKWWKKSDVILEKPHELGLQFAHLRQLNDQMDLVFSGAFISNQSHIQNQFNKRVRNNIKFRYSPKKVEGLTLSLNSNLLYRNNEQFFIWNNDSDGAYQGQSFEDRYFRYSIDPVIKYFFKDKNQISLINRIYYDQRLNSGGSRDFFGLKIFNDFQYKRTFKNGSKDMNGTFSTGFVNNRDILKASSFDEYLEEGKSTFIFNTLSTYFQGDYGWRDLTLAFGGRFDFVTLDNTTKASRPVFNAGVSYEIGAKNFVRFGFGQSFRIPSLAERYVKEKITSVELGGSSLDIFAGPNPDIRPETGYTYELGFKKIIKSPNFEAKIDAAIFYQQFIDFTEFTFGNYIDPSDSSSYVGFSMQNVADARTLGWETSISASNSFKNVVLSYQFGYTYNYTANAEEDTTLRNFGALVRNTFSAFKIKDEVYDAFYDDGDQNILYGMMRYRFRHVIKSDFNIDIKKVSIGTNIRYYGFMDRVDAVFALFIPNVQDYRDSQLNKGDFVFDFRAQYHFSENFTLGFICKNAFNNNYQLRPAKPDAPRSLTFQGKFNF